MRMIKGTVLSLLALLLISVLAGYLFLASSLPDLDGNKSSIHLSSAGSIERDRLGAAVINAQTHYDAAFLMGYAHSQDRLFQMDLLRRSAAGRLAEVVGKRALERDKDIRFFQFDQKAQAIVGALSEHHRELLEQYANGVNAFIDEYGSAGFEFALTGTKMEPWQAKDTILATLSMYIDLQKGQVERDFENTAIRDLFGPDMLDFMYQTSRYQSAIDLSVDPVITIKTPIIERPQNSIALEGSNNALNDAYEPRDIGSNNWAVSSALTDSTSALLSSDMHLGLNVPIIWYRAQMNYQHEGSNISVTGVSLPGTPLIIAGSTEHIAWGFTNSNVDNVDWVKLEPNTPTQLVTEQILVKGQAPLEYQIEMSEFGPVRTLNDQKYALAWVALMPYAVNMDIADMPLQRSAEQAMELAKSVAIPVQNMVIADKSGNIGWQLTGAITSRTKPSLAAIEQADFDSKWYVQDTQPAYIYNPSSERIWTGNARVVSTQDLVRYGDGGYALGARQRQILELLQAQEQFNEQDFNRMQLDNRALFLMPWHQLLTDILNSDSKKFAVDIAALNDWQACACADSIGYTLVRRFRSAVIGGLMQGVEDSLQTIDIDMRQSMRLIEGGIWQLINEQSNSWLPANFDDYPSFMIATYEQSKNTLIEKHNANPTTLAGLEWGNVNALSITHPFAGSLGPFARFINMPLVAGYGDSYMPAVQGKSFGASQRLIVRPGELEKAILTVPGGQSMHPLSDFFDAGFDEYASGSETPLLPQAIEHTISFVPRQ